MPTGGPGPSPGPTPSRLRRTAGRSASCVRPSEARGRPVTSSRPCAPSWWREGVSMRAVVFSEWQTFHRLETVDQPEPGPGAVLLQVDGAGACHSDVDNYKIRIAARREREGT